MAKKKTVENIKAAPVLRAQSVDPTPATPTVTKSYGVRDDWKDESISNYVAFKSVNGEIQDLTVNGEPAGGGGGGNTFIAAAVVIDTSGMVVKCSGPVIASYGQENAHFDYYNETSLITTFPNNLTIPIFEGEISETNIYLDGYGTSPVTVTGDITNYGDGNFGITGSGTIRIS